MTAIILAGGKGTRLAPFVAPKCLLTVSGISILQRLLKHLYESEHIRQAVICTGYRASDIEASVREHGWVETGEGARMPVDCSNNGENAPMGARLLQARQEMGGNKDYGLGRVLIIYGDELTDLDISKLLDRHGDCKGMTFTAAYANTAGGTVDIDADGRPHIVDEACRVINIGFVVVEPACWALLKPEDGLSDWINRVSEEHGKVRIYYHDGLRATINSLADLRGAEEMWSNGR